MIRLAEISDLERVLQITHETISEIYSHYYAEGVVRFFLGHHSREHILSDIEDGLVWLLKEDDRMVGTVTIKENAVTRLFVLPGYQSRGYGSQLMDFAENKIAEQFTHIHIDSSLAAKEMYLKRGYKEKKTCRIEADNRDILIYDEMEKQVNNQPDRINYNGKIFIPQSNTKNGDVDIESAKAYLKKNEKKLLAGGKSGARVYDVGGKCVLKQINRSELENDELYEAYRKEAWWYADGGAGLACLPEVFDLRSTDEEISILMKRYQTLSRREINAELLEKIMRALASVHVLEIPPLLKQKQHTAWPLSEEQIRISVEGWRTVLDEHPGVFEKEPLKHIAEEINRIILWHDSEETVLSHGDFHWDNLLMDNEGRIIICDWQGVEAGARSGDLSFFFRETAGRRYTAERAESR